MALRGAPIQQTILLQFRDQGGRAWHAGATMTMLRPVDPDPHVDESKMIIEGDGMELTGIKLVIP